MPEYNFPIIDAHTHIFPDKVAERAVGGISAFYDLPMAMAGTTEHLIETSRNAGVVRMLVTSTATSANQVKAINNFLKHETDDHPEFFAFGTLYPLMDDNEIDAELDRMEGMGFKGIKLHPDFQKIEVDSPEIIRIAKKAAGRFPILTHAGDYRYDFSNPDRLRRLIESAPPELIVIAAHLGGWSVWEEAAEKLSPYGNLYVDTCSSLRFIPAETAGDILKAYGRTKVLFGTDYPMWNISEEFDSIAALHLSDEWLHSILHDNAARLFSL
ncbi:MAG: amidohydrolase family protein [Saccharofermentanales bacterium]